jgi:hypothetical protein
VTRAAARRRRYKVDPDFRAAILESNRRSKQRDRNPNRARLNTLARSIWHLREAIATRQRWLEDADKRLLAMVAERESLKLGARKATTREAA